MKRCQEIFSLAKSHDRSLLRFLQDATKLTDRLLDLCNRSVEGTNATLSVAQDFRPLLRLIDDKYVID
jgi:serine/threonine-protein kinase ATR